MAEFIPIKGAESTFDYLHKAADRHFMDKVPGEESGISHLVGYLDRGRMWYIMLVISTTKDVVEKVGIVSIKKTRTKGDKIKMQVYISMTNEKKEMEKIGKNGFDSIGDFIDTHKEIVKKKAKKEEMLKIYKKDTVYEVQRSLLKKLGYLKSEEMTAVRNLS